MPMSPRDWKCLMMTQFELGKYAEVKATWVLSTEVSSWPYCSRTKMKNVRVFNVHVIQKVVQHQ